MRGRSYCNAVLICMVVGGIVVVIGTVDTGSVTSSPAAGVAKRLPSPPASRTNEPKPAPLVIAPAIPTTLTVRVADQELIKSTPVDQKLLEKGVDGRVKPGNLPGLYVADGTSTLPGTHQGTVVVGGHAKAAHDAVFNPLMNISKTDIDHSYVVLELPGGQLTYTIEAIYVVDKVDLSQQRELADNRPGRILLITCDVEGDRDTFQNLIVVGCDASHGGCGTL